MDGAYTCHSGLKLRWMQAQLGGPNGVPGLKQPWKPISAPGLLPGSRIFPQPEAPRASPHMHFPKWQSGWLPSLRGLKWVVPSKDLRKRSGCSSKSQKQRLQSQPHKPHPYLHCYSYAESHRLQVNTARALKLRGPEMLRVRQAVKAHGFLPSSH